MKPVFLAIALIAISASHSSAAIVKEDVVGCRNEADLKRPITGSHVNNKPAVSNDASKFKSGACTPLTKGVTVSIDQKKGELLCVRPYGGIDCFWAPTTAINQNSDQSTPSPLDRNFKFKPMLNGSMPGLQTSF
jgi:hypothetical protein